MTIKIKDDDYIICLYKGKPSLMVVLNAKARRCVLEKTLITDEPENVTIEFEHVQCNLGPEPRVGKVFGVDVTPFKKTIETERYGPIHVFRNLEKGEMKRLKKSMDKIYKIFKAKATVSFLPFGQTKLEPKKGKYSGYYKFKQKGLDQEDTVGFHPDNFLDVEYNSYLIAHEWAHAVWYRCVSQQIKAKWLNLYQKRVTLSQINTKELEGLCEDIIQYEGGIGAYNKEIGDDHVKRVLKEVVNYFKRYHKMDVKDMELMLQENSSTFSDMWPTDTMLTEDRPDVSEYAMTKVEEFFAESFAFYIVGKTLPKDVQKGIEYTVKRLGSFISD